MKNTIHKALIPAAIAAAALLGGIAYAQDPVPDAVPAPVPATVPATVPDAVPAPPPGAAARSVLPGEAVPLPAAHTSGNVSYVTGGIPYEQLPAFTAARSQYPLNIEVYERDGSRNEFTADVNVRLINAKTGDVVLEAKTEGPYLWAKVPPGQYKLETTLNGKTKESRVSVGGAHSARAIVVFPDGTTE